MIFSTSENAIEGLGVGEGDDVGAGGKELAELDVGGSHFFEIVGELVGIRFLFGGGLSVGLGHDIGETGVFDEVGTAIFPEEPGDVFVLLEVLREER
jgi:hypothetical protein